MNGWEIACVVVGMVVTLCATKGIEAVVGFFMALLPLYFNFWRG